MKSLSPHVLFVWLLTLFGIARPDTVEFKAIKEGVLEGRLQLAHPKIAERYLRLRVLFEKTGCADLREQRAKGSKEPNLICPIEGTGPVPRRIVVGAHYDSAGGNGTIDNWTGAILLPTLAEFMREKPRRHSFHFVGFAAEEKGLLGSRAYLNSIGAEERGQIAAVVTMDSMGLSPTKFWPNSSSKELVALAAQLAGAMRLQFAGVNVDAVGTTDSMTFHKAGLSVLSLHSITQETLPLINSKLDTRKSLSWKDYYDTHRFVSALLAYLDQKLP